MARLREPGSFRIRKAWRKDDCCHRHGRQSRVSWLAAGLLPGCSRQDGTFHCRRVCPLLRTPTNRAWSHRFELHEGRRRSRYSQSTNSEPVRSCRDAAGLGRAGNCSAEVRHGYRHHGQPAALLVSHVSEVQLRFTGRSRFIYVCALGRVEKGNRVKYSKRILFIFSALLLVGSSIQRAGGQGTADARKVMIPHASWNCGMADGIPAPESGTVVFEAQMPIENTYAVGKTPYGTRQVVVLKDGV